MTGSGVPMTFEQPKGPQGMSDANVLDAPEVLLSGLGFGESARWRQGRLWVLDRGCFSCALGGDDGRTLLMVAQQWDGGSDDGASTGQVLTTRVAVAASPRSGKATE